MVTFSTSNISPHIRTSGIHLGNPIQSCLHITPLLSVRTRNQASESFGNHDKIVTTTEFHHFTGPSEGRSLVSASVHHCQNSSHLY